LTEVISFFFFSYSFFDWALPPFNTFSFIQDPFLATLPLLPPDRSTPPHPAHFPFFFFTELFLCVFLPPPEFLFLQVAAPWFPSVMSTFPHLFCLDPLFFVENFRNICRAFSFTYGCPGGSFFSIYPASFGKTFFVSVPWSTTLVFALTSIEVVLSLESFFHCLRVLAARG